MYKFLSLAAAFALVSAVHSTARAGDTADDTQDKNVIERGAEATGGAIKKGAEATGHAIKEGAEATGHAIKKGAEVTGSALGITDTEKERFEANERGEHRMKGMVTAIDRDTGQVDLKTADGPMQLHFPADSLTGIEVGAPMTVVVAFATPDNLSPTSEGSKPKREVAGDQPLRGEHWMKGKVLDVNAKTGMVQITTEDMPLTVQFTPDAVAILKPGDNIAIEMAFEPATTGPAHPRY
jgi:hypothetical protein